MFSFMPSWSAWCQISRVRNLLGLDLVVLLIVVMGGRVIPFFTERALPGVVMKRWPIIEWLAPLSVIMFLLADFLFADSLQSATLAALAACANSIRLAGWYTHRYWRVPLLWYCISAMAGLSRDSLKVGELLERFRFSLRFTHLRWAVSAY